MPQPFIVYLSLLILCLHSSGARAAEASSDRASEGHTALTAADPRQHLAAHSPAGLHAVAQLEVPGVRLREGYAQPHTESCSGTLLTPLSTGARPLLLTAWHCLEDYRDLSMDLRLKLALADGGHWQGRARPLLSGGSMAADWALLRLPRLPGLPGAVPEVRLHRGPLPAGTPLIMAGFSRDAGAGRSGQWLSYDARCSITGHSGEDVLTDCRAHKGASGGAVFVRDELGMALAGVISRGDGQDRSIFVPVARFATRVQAHR